MKKVIFKEHPKPDGSFLGEIKLHRPKVLNALDLEMILAIKNQLNKWKENPRLSLVFLHGEGEKAFCAGGDVKGIYSSIVSSRQKKEDPGKAAQPFFENEYRLDYLIHTYPRSVVAWGHGFVMGGGLGLFLGASHKILTESASLSMPEISLGLFPDVGASYLLSRLPWDIGWYLALTGYRLNGREAGFLNLVDFSFKNADKGKIFQTLISASFADKEGLNRVLKNIPPEDTSSPQENRIEKYKSKIVSLFESKKLKDIYKKLYNSVEEDKIWKKNRQTFFRGSPTSAGIICEQFKRAKRCGLKEVFQGDLVLALNCVRGFDFPEGVKTLLVEKTGLPNWKPSSIEDVEESQIQKYFESPSGWTNPLQNL